jgi:hypothetical protein
MADVNSLTLRYSHAQASKTSLPGTYNFICLESYKGLQGQGSAMQGAAML